METIYIDSLFLLNLLIDYLMCLLTGRVCSLVLRRGRYLAAAIIGAAFSVAVYLPGLSWLGSPLMILSLWLVMALCAFGREESFLRCGAVFAAVSAAFGGFIWAIQLAGGYPAFDMRTLLLSFALCYGMLQLIFRGKAKIREQRHVRVRLELGGRSSEFVVLVDTGNHLTDPISGRRVLLATPKALAPLFPGLEELLELEGAELMELSEGLEELRGRLRLIPFSSLGGSGLLCAFRPDRALAEGKELEIVAAVSQRAAGAGFQGLI